MLGAISTHIHTHTNSGTHTHSTVKSFPLSQKFDITDTVFEVVAGTHCLMLVTTCVSYTQAESTNKQ